MEYKIGRPDDYDKRIYKWCPKCKMLKFIHEYHNSKNMADGKDKICKKCKQKYAIDNKEKIAVRQKKYRADRLEESKQYCRDYYHSHKKEILERKRHTKQIIKRK